MLEKIHQDNDWPFQRSAHCTNRPVRASPFAPEMPATETPALSQTEISMPTIALYLGKCTKQAPAPHHHAIAVAATAAVLCGSVLHRVPAISGCPRGELHRLPVCGARVGLVA